MNDPKTRTTPVHHVKVHATCPKCINGEMIFLDTPENVFRLDVYPQVPQIKHACDQCGHAEFYQRGYPHVEARDGLEED